MSKCCVKWLISCIHYIKRKSFKNTFRDASPQYNFSHICAQQFSLNSTVKALVCSLRAQYACCFDADSVLTETKRDMGTNSVWQQPFSLAGIRHGSLYWGEDECCDKVSRTEGGMRVHGFDCLIRLYFMACQAKWKKRKKGLKKKKSQSNILGQNSLSQIVMGSWDSGESLIVLSLYSLHFCSKPRLCAQTMTIFS